MTSVTAILTLVAFASEQELLAESTQDWLVELPLNELVAIHLEDIALALSNGTLTAETTLSGFKRALPNVLLDCQQRSLSIVHSVIH